MVGFDGSKGLFQPKGFCDVGNVNTYVQLKTLHLCLIHVLPWYVLGVDGCYFSFCQAGSTLALD